MGVCGHLPGPKASGLGNSAGKVEGLEVASRYPGREEVERPRYLENEGGPRLSSPPSPPARPPGPNPTERVQSRGAWSRSPGRRLQHPDPSTGRSPAPQLAEAPAEKAPKAAAWSRNGDARSLSRQKKGRSGRGRTARVGRRDAGDAGAPGSGRSSSQTELRPALGAPKRGPVAGRGVGKEAGGEEGGGGKAEDGGGGEGKWGALPPFHPTFQSRAHSQPNSHPKTTTSMRSHGGHVALSGPAAASTCRSLSAGAPATPLGRGLLRRALRAAGPSPQERRAKPPGAPGAGPQLSSAAAWSAPRNSRPANFKGPPRTSKSADRPAAPVFALTRDPRARSAARPRRRPGQGPGPSPSPWIGSQQPRAPPGRSRCQGTWGV